MLHSNLSTNELGHLTIGGVDAVSLAEKYGTPLYVLDEDRVREKCRTYVSALSKYFRAGSRALYASKALSFKGIYAVAAEENMCVDVVSGGELYTALKAGFPAENIYFHGNNKTVEEIRFGIDSGIGCFVADNFDELEELDKAAGEKGIRQKILLRLTPGIDPHTFEAVSTGKVDSKFGVAIETGQAEEFVVKALHMPNLELCGYHCHIGSQIFDPSPFFDAADIMLEFRSYVSKRYGYNAEILNLGGGLGVRYVESDPAIDYDDCLRQVAEHIEDLCDELSTDVPIILMEPGRAIVADAGVTLYTVGSLKTITGYKSYAAIDGGMTDDPRYALYGSKYTALIADRASSPADFICTIGGRNCESGDLIGEDMPLQKPKRGDTLAVLVTGAYNYSMANNYNRVTRPPIVLLHDGQDRLAVRRETFEDLTACDL